MDYVEWLIDTLTKGKGRKIGYDWDVSLFFEEKMLTPSFESSLDHFTILLLLDLHLTILILSFLLCKVKTILWNCNNSVT